MIDDKTNDITETEFAISLKFAFLFHFATSYFSSFIPSSFFPRPFSLFLFPSLYFPCPVFRVLFLSFFSLVFFPSSFFFFRVFFLLSVFLRPFSFVLFISLFFPRPFLFPFRLFTHLAPLSSQTRGVWRRFSMLTDNFFLLRSYFLKAPLHDNF